MSNTFNRRNLIDPAVAEIIADMERKQRISSLPKSRQAKARRDARRHKVGLDLPPALHEALREIAEEEHISISGLVTFYLYRGVVEHRAGHVELSPYKRVSRCARFEYVIDLDKVMK